MIQTFRPAVLPDNKKLVYYPVIAVLIVSTIGLALSNPVMIVLPLIILAVFPGLPLFFHALFHLLVKIEVYPEKIIVTDLAGNRLVGAGRRQEIRFEDIWCMYYLDKEINLLVSLAEKLKEYKVPHSETNYTKGNLTAKYGVPDELLRTFEESSQKALTDYTAAGVLMKLDEVFDKYEIPKQARKTIKQDLSKDENFNLEYLRGILSEYPVNSRDIDELADEFTEIDVDVLAPFLLTKVNIAGYKKAESRRHGASITARTNVGVVFANKDGSEKLYLMNFHDLSDRDLRRLVKIINEKRPGIKYLMNKTQINRLK
jgi:hypothetical protein